MCFDRGAGDGVQWAAGSDLLHSGDGFMAGSAAMERHGRLPGQAHAALLPERQQPGNSINNTRDDTHCSASGWCIRLFSMALAGCLISVSCKGKFIVAWRLQCCKQCCRSA